MPLKNYAKAKLLILRKILYIRMRNKGCKPGTLSSKDVTNLTTQTNIIIENKAITR